MSSPYSPPPESKPPETTDDLVLREPEREGNSEKARVSVREMASRIPESLSAIGRDISRTIERAISMKDEYMVAVRISPQAQEKLAQLEQAGVFRNRAEAAAFLIDEGIKAQSPLFERVELKLAEIERLREELRGMVGERRQP